MAVGPVVTRGYGGFGSVNLVVVRGYSAGEAVRAAIRTYPRGLTQDDRRSNRQDGGRSNRQDAAIRRRNG